MTVTGYFVRSRWRSRQSAQSELAIAFSEASWPRSHRVSPGACVSCGGGRGIGRSMSPGTELCREEDVQRLLPQVANQRSDARTGGNVFNVAMLIAS